MRCLLDPNNLTAISTIVIAVFTAVLAYVGWRQAQLTRQAIQLGRDEFTATFRPKLVVRFIQGPFYTGPDDDTTALVTFTNIGGSDAIIATVGGCLAIRENGIWQPPGLQATPAPVSEIIIRPGGRHTITIRAVTGEQGEGVSFLWGFMSANNADNPTGEICAVGEVQYLDRNGVRRQTGFIRVYDVRRQSWRVDKDSEFEYCD